MTSPGPFRFWGKQDPRQRTPVPIRAEQPVADATDGVATLRLYAPIDSWGEFWGTSAAEFAQVLDSLPSETSEIRLHVNSPGGEVYEGLAILEQLRGYDARVVAVVEGIAASIASVIAAGADEVVMGRNSELMIHDAWGITIGDARDHQRTVDSLNRLSDNLASVYAEKAGGELATWREAMLAETWFSAAEAVEAGLADSVAEKAGTPSSKAAFDLSVFSHQGRAQAPDPVLPSEGERSDPEDQTTPAASRRQQVRHRMNALSAGRPPG